jgi:two-component system, cell cycle response regulator DivK
MARILVVEDDLDNQDVIRRMLELMGHAVLIANNGNEGLKAADQLRPDLIMMDMSMPEMDGWTLTTLLKANPELCYIPIIAVTSHAMREDQRRAREVGCDAYMSKPIDYFKLNEMVQRYLARVHVRARTVS